MRAAGTACEILSSKKVRSARIVAVSYTCLSAPNLMRLVTWLVPFIASAKPEYQLSSTAFDPAEER